MNLHEYQSKELFTSYGIPVPTGQLAHTPEEASNAFKALSGDVCVVKAQIHAGGRGKVGGVKLVKSAAEAAEVTDSLLGKYMVTHQTDAHGLPVKTVWVEETTAIASELYLSVLLDRDTSRVAFMVSAAGGMDIEEVAVTSPEKLLSVAVDPVAGLQPYQCRKVAFAMGLNAKQANQLSSIMAGIYRLFVEKDASLVEVNPLVVTEAGDLIALDAKITLDEGALYRQQELKAKRDPSQEDEKEYDAQQHGLSYITLDGTIGCMVNGAGLAMATMDLVKLHGGSPANFLDVGGGTNAEKVKEAFKIILSDSKVKAILVNIFGGIVRCNLIAEGIIQASKELDLTVPVVVRLEGTNAEQGREMLNNSGLKLIAAESLTEAAKKVVEVAV